MTNPLIITMPMLLAAVHHAPEEHIPDIILSSLDFDETEEDQINSIAQYFTECRNWDKLQTQNFSFDPEKLTITINKDYAGNPLFLFHHIELFSDWVSRSYDEELYPWENDAWKLGYCSGDDDVDYNGSYLDVAIAFIEFWLIHNGYVKPEDAKYAI